MGGRDTDISRVEAGRLAGEGIAGVAGGAEKCGGGAELSAQVRDGRFGDTPRETCYFIGLS